jgi:hypothetical protein
MLNDTADGENGFQGANTILVSPTVSFAAIPAVGLSTSGTLPRMRSSHRTAMASLRSAKGARKI